MGSTVNPRLTRKTNPKAIDIAEEADFEEELSAYEQGEFRAPVWGKQALKKGKQMKEVNSESPTRSASPEARTKERTAYIKSSSSSRDMTHRLPSNIK